MLHEKSVGILVYRMHPQEGVQYLILYHHGSYWNIPKGHVEEGESEIETGLRELKEEAGLENVEVVDGWRQQSNYIFKEKFGEKKDQLIKKDFIVYLAKTELGKEPIISHEHNGYAWLTSEMADKYLKFKNLKEILAEADSYLKNIKS